MLKRSECCSNLSTLSRYPLGLGCPGAAAAGIWSLRDKKLVPTLTSRVKPTLLRALFGTCDGGGRSWSATVRACCGSIFMDNLCIIEKVCFKKMAEKDRQFEPLTSNMVKGLNDKLYEKRKAAALDIERSLCVFASQSSLVRAAYLFHSRPHSSRKEFSFVSFHGKYQSV